MSVLVKMLYVRAQESVLIYSLKNVIGKIIIKTLLRNNSRVFNCLDENFYLKILHRLFDIMF